MFSAAKTSGPSGYNLTNSLRFRSSASAYLNRTPASAGNRQIWTWSGWVKRGQISIANNGIFSAGTSFGVNNNNLETISFPAGDTLEIASEIGGATQYRLITTQVFRDPSAWYHVIVSVDTTQATASNRIKIYINGTQITAFGTSTYPAQNYNCWTNSTNAHRIGSRAAPDFDGYLTEINFIDGQALTPSSFGSTNATTGVWQPAKYTGTYGTNGFYLPFSLSATSSYAGSFNGSNQYLSLPNSSAWDLSTGDWTIETWFKFSSISSNGSAIVGNADVFFGNGGFGVRIDPSYAITLYGNGNSQGNYAIGSSALSANQWHHLAIVRSGTGANSVSLYLDGVRYTATGNGANNPTFASSSTGIAIGYGNYANSYFNGNISNLRIVKGYAQYPINAAGISVPSAPLTAVTGTSLLTLQNATIIDNSTNAFTITNNNTVTSATASPFVANIFGDKSGNNNDWAGNNINYSTAGTTYDSMTDVPTLTSATVANYCVLNPVAYYGGYNVLSQGNLQFTSGNANWMRAVATFAVSSGKWYWEITANNSLSQMHGILTATTTTYYSGATNWVGYDSTGYGYFSDNGQKWNNNAGVTYGSTFGAGDIIGVAFDADNGTLTFYKNNVSQGTAFTGLTSGPYVPAVSVATTSGTNTCSANFGQRPFAYTPPTGYVALNTYNLPTSTIVQGSVQMNALTYTGSGGTTNITGMTFQPDLIWVKNRSNAVSHCWVDSNRGAPNQLGSDLTAAENSGGNDRTVYGGISTILSNGFTAVSGTDPTYKATNGSGQTYVAWYWKANQGTNTTNTSGSITTTTSVNSSAGFSIFTFTGTGASASVGHGLGVAPKFMIFKQRNGANNWNVLTNATGSNQYGFLNLTTAFAAAGETWTSTVINIGANFTNGSTYVCYAWAEIAGFSKFGSYTGNGSTDGTFVYTGFRPKYILIKVTSTTEDWYVYDTSRITYNLGNIFIYADLANAESTGATGIDILSNGFKQRQTGVGNNSNGATYIYAAFAENPFKNALAR